MKAYKKFVAVGATVIIFLIPLILIIMPKSDFSENENRVLKKFPEFNAQNLFSGKFNRDIEEYINDHFPFRDELVAVKSNTLKIVGYKEIGGVFIAGDRLLQHIKQPKTEEFANRVNKLCDNLKETGVNLSLMVIPTDAFVYREQLPANAPDVVDEQKAISDVYDRVNCTTIDVAGELLKEKESNDVFYRLDHHWNYYGAYAGYRAFEQAVGMKPKELRHFMMVEVTDGFKGSLYSKALTGGIDSDVIAVPAVNDAISVDNRDKKEITDTYYHKEFLDMKDKYCYFGGGNPSLMIIENKDLESDRELLIIKDSFANSMIPFLIGDFKKIHVIDLRYYIKHASDYVVDNREITDVLVMYNIDSLNTNNGIIKIK